MVMSVTVLVVSIVTLVHIAIATTIVFISILHVELQIRPLRRRLPLFMDKKVSVLLAAARSTGVAAQLQHIQQLKLQLRLHILLLLALRLQLLLQLQTTATTNAVEVTDTTTIHSYHQNLYHHKYYLTLELKLRTTAISSSVTTD